MGQSKEVSSASEHEEAKREAVWRTMLCVVIGVEDVRHVITFVNRGRRQLYRGYIGVISGLYRGYTGVT